ncbi:FAD/FMN-containing dehydrogenase [Propionicimonas paludicola]|uniref:FAD/FMN-containing dehydrogenase n=1 Tax=Propionicimonas paludicola TaxID=185243 RepID=A0A2A9CPM1_9ACTN|nr:FAD-binding and (Fe-S)-binding domain-containing protein [Propionicimonas paludicola]PFG16035.1 FAD/FMN-containing dehydrogenase [Propionicimonas paludicola]
MPAGANTALDRLAAQGFDLDRTTLTRALYGGDASLYRVIPAAVARPTSVDELARLTRAALDARIAITSRGSGTSIAGNAIGTGLVIDCSKLTRITHLDPSGRAAIVEPGVVGGRLNAAAGRHGLRLGPDPSTIDRCTIGGMIGNNACGARALGYGRTSDNLLGLEVITGTGDRLSLGAGQPHSPILDALQQLVAANLGLIRTEFGRFSRQVSGYALEHLLPENGFNVARFLAGSEGTLAVVLGARLRLVPVPRLTTLVPIGYPDMAAAADDAALVTGFGPTAIEGLDRRLLQAAGDRLGPGLPLPPGDGWLLVELAGDDPAELQERAQSLSRAVHGLAGSPITDPRQADGLWRLRADAAGLAAISGARPSHAGWEDAAVPVAALGGYLRAFERLLAAHGLHGVPYGHFGEGCLHVRIDFALSSPDGVAGYRRFVEEAADLAAEFGGSASGEHGDGRARSELLARQYSPAALNLFAAVKQIFDPNNLLNPGVLVEPRPLDLDLRRPRAEASRLPRLRPEFVEQAHRCTGVGKCLTPDGAMCPSYQATGAEQDSTRGRARVLQELIDGELIAPDWRSAEVAEALELCLSCKACVSECPTGTDLAAAKSQVLDEAFRGRLRPRVHYSLGRLQTWAGLIGSLPGLPDLANATLAASGLRRLVAAVAGVDHRRRLPRFSRRPAHRRVGLPFVDRTELSTVPRPVAIWIDPFTDAAEAEQLVALTQVLGQAGLTPLLVRRRVDAGVALISTGQRRRAARALRRTLDVLHPIAAAGVPIVGLEPSEIAALRHDAASLIADPRLEAVAAGVHTLAEILSTSDWTPPDLSGLTVVAQPHCHHAAVLGWATDAALLARTGARLVTIEGCCGMAGDFGMTHYDTSVAVAGLHLLPAIEAAGPDAIVLADGFSCRYQVADLRGRSAITLAELLVGGPTSGS